MASPDFGALTIEARAALDAIAKGDPKPYKVLYSDRDDISLGNPFGGFGLGKDAVYEQLERAASYYRDGQTISFETVVASVGPELAYTVEIERFRTKVGGGDTLTDIALRVTCVYRLEGDRWRLLHRHADPRVERQTPDSVVVH